MRIYIYGFAHSGTTILRRLIGDHSLIHDYVKEIETPPERDNVVFKCPILPNEVQKNCKRIMIMKNPYDIFGSFFLRFGPEYLTTPLHTIADYEEFVRHYYATGDIKIKYEHLNKESLPLVFDLLGLEYEGESDRDALIGEGVETPEECPPDQKEGENHGLYRQWQINQPFENMTGRSAPYLPKEGLRLLLESEIIQKLYPHV